MWWPWRLGRIGRDRPWPWSPGPLRGQRDLPVCHCSGRLGDSRRAARRDDRGAGDCHDPHGAAGGDRSPADGGGRSRQLHAHRHRQDRHSHGQRADGARSAIAGGERPSPSPAKDSSRRARCCEAKSRWRRAPTWSWTNWPARACSATRRICITATMTGNGAATPSTSPCSRSVTSWAGSAATTLDAHPQVNEIPFESEHQYAATFNEVDGHVRVFVKGAPERVLSMCSDGGNRPELEAVALEMAGRGLAGAGARRGAGDAGSATALTRPVGAVGISPSSGSSA